MKCTQNICLTGPKNTKKLITTITTKKKNEVRNIHIISSQLQYIHVSKTTLNKVHGFQPTSSDSTLINTKCWLAKIR